MATTSSTPFPSSQTTKKPGYGELAPAWRTNPDPNHWTNQPLNDATMPIQVDKSTGKVTSGLGVSSRNAPAHEALLGGGGRAVTPLGQVVDPNQMPFWDVSNRSAGLGSAYLNLLQLPGRDPALVQGNEVIRRNLLNDAAFQGVNRGLPGSYAMGQARGEQLDAVGGVGRSGQVARNGQVAAMQAAQNVGSRQAADQATLDAALMDQAMGRGGPTAAQSMFGSALNQNIAAQRALSQGVRGGSAAAAMRQGTQAGVQLGLEAQNQAAALRAREQQAAQGLLAQNLATGREQDASRVGLRGALSSQAAQDALARDATMAELLGQLRGQDIQTSGLGLQGRQLDDQQRQQNILNALSAQQLLTNFGLADQGMLLDAAGVMGNLQTGQQNVATQRRQLELTERGQNIGLIGAGVSGVSSGVASLV